MLHTHTQAKRGIELTISAVVIIIIVLATLFFIIRFFTIGFEESSEILSDLPQTFKEAGGDKISIVTGRCNPPNTWILPSTPGDPNFCPTAPAGCTDPFGSTAADYTKCRKCASEIRRANPVHKNCSCVCD